MSKKFRLILAGSLLLVAASWLLFFYTVTGQFTIAINHKVLKTSEQFSSVDKVKNWYRFPEGSQDSIALREQTPVQLLMDIINPGSKNTFRFTINGDTADIYRSLVTLQYPTTLFNKLTGETAPVKLARKNLAGLKEYMEDTRRFYGYEMQLVKVEDTAFLFRTVVVPAAEKRAGTRKVFDELIGFAATADAGYNGVRICYYVPGDEEVRIFAGVGVTRMVDPPLSTGIEYKRMPYGKNLLVASYQGTLEDVTKVYRAMEQFKNDHNMTSMAIPFQKILSDGYDFSDDQVVQLKVYFPVF